MFVGTCCYQFMQVMTIMNLAQGLLKNPQVVSWGTDIRNNQKDDIDFIHQEGQSLWHQAQRSQNQQRLWKPKSFAFLKYLPPSHFMIHHQPVATISPAPPSTAAPPSTLCRILSISNPTTLSNSIWRQFLRSSSWAVKPPSLPSAATHPPPIAPLHPFTFNHQTNLAPSSDHPSPPLSIWWTPFNSLLCIRNLWSRLSSLSWLPFSCVPSFFRWLVWLTNMFWLF